MLLFSALNSVSSRLTVWHLPFSRITRSFFLGTLDDEDDEGFGGGRGGELSLSPGGTKRPRAPAPVGMSLPGHEPLVVAAAAAWVMGRSAVRPEWDAAFIGQLFE